MKEFNFNTIKNLPVPEQWIENALLIPEEEDQRLAVIPLTNRHCEESAEPTTRQSQPFWRKPRVIAMAASLMLVTALSIALFLSMGNKTPLATKSDSKPDATQIVWSTDEYGATVATEIVAVPDDGNQNGAHPTEKLSASSQSVENALGGGDSTSPTASSGQGVSAPSATQKGSTSQSPTASPQKPTSAPSPVDPDPTEPAANRPTETPWYRPPTETPWEKPPELPSETSWEQYPTVPPKPTEPPEYCDVIDVTFWGKSVPYGRTLYVRLFYEGKGSALGDRDPFSDQHLATVLSWDADTIHVYYDPKEHGIMPESGCYRYEIYRQALPGYQAIILEKTGYVYLNP